MTRPCFNLFMLTNRYTVDGLRIDTAKNVELSFFPDFMEAAGVASIGEVLIGGVSEYAPFTKVLDSALNYPMYVCSKESLDGVLTEV